MHTCHHFVPHPKVPRTSWGFLEQGLGFRGWRLGSHYEGPRASGQEQYGGGQSPSLRLGIHERAAEAEGDKALVVADNYCDVDGHHV